MVQAQRKVNTIASAVCQHRLVRTALAGVFLLLLTAAPIARGETDGGEEVNVLIRADTSIEALQTRSAGNSHLGWRRISVPVDGNVGTTLENVERELGTDIFLDRRYPLLGGADEPLFDSQWALENTGQAGGKQDADIDVTGAWSIAEGAGVVVAVVDSGVDADHPDLRNQIWQNQDELPNGVDDDDNGFVDDVAGWDFESFDNDPTPSSSTPAEAHGTMVAGIIAAEVNGTGIAGVAPRARIMNLRACNQGDCFTFNAVAAIEYAVDNGADIINLSFGGPWPENDNDRPLEDAIEYARQHDVLVVTAAGNTHPDDLEQGHIIVPAELPHENNVAVAATNRDDRIGQNSFYGANIDIAAPGYEILSTFLPSYSTGSGTSFAAPHVAGAAALVKSFHQQATHAEIAARLQTGADTPSHVAGKVQSGRLNAENALTAFLDILGNTFESDIKWAAQTGVTKGCNPPANTLFCPDDVVTRGQMAAFIKRHLDLPAASKNHFTDDNGSTFENDINRLADAGITKGCNPPANDHFCPDDPVTREQMAAFLARALNLSGVDHGGFDDVHSSNTFFQDIGELATAGITKGCNPPANSLFCPDEEVTRGQMAAFLHRADG